MRVPMSMLSLRLWLRLGHPRLERCTRTMSPAGYIPEPSPSPALRPLCPVKSRNMNMIVSAYNNSNSKPLGPPPSMELPLSPVTGAGPGPGRAPSALTFGSRASSREGHSSSISSMDEHNQPLRSCNPSVEDSTTSYRVSQSQLICISPYSISSM